MKSNRKKEATNRTEKHGTSPEGSVVSRETGEIRWWGQHLGAKATRTRKERKDKQRNLYREITGKYPDERGKNGHGGVGKRRSC
jgi:hypothetical protein